MEEKLLEILLSFGYGVYRQGSLPSSPESYPESFFTFWNTSTVSHSHYDNNEYGTEVSYDVMFYGTDAENVYNTITAARKKLEENGWIIPSKEHDIASGIISHVCRAISVQFLEIGGN